MSRKAKFDIAADIAERNASMPFADLRLPDYLDLVDALSVMVMDFDCHVTRDGRAMVGVGDDFCYPGMPRRVKSLEDVRAVLAKHHAAHPRRVYEARNAERAKAARP